MTIFLSMFSKPMVIQGTKKNFFISRSLRSRRTFKRKWKKGEHKKVDETHKFMSFKFNNL